MLRSSRKPFRCRAARRQGVDGPTGSPAEAGGDIDHESFIRRIPKVELHCHLEGAIQPKTGAELAGKNGVSLTVEVLEELYRSERIDVFLSSLGRVCETLVQRDDFARVAYESLEVGVNQGGLRYREMFFSPTRHTMRGVPYRDVIDGLLDGIGAAESDLGVRCRLIPCIVRNESLGAARQMLDEVLEDRRDEIIGLGMGGDEVGHPPEMFTEVFQRAGRAGLRRTAHTSHDGPAIYILTCLDELGCERVDHGYHVIDDPEVLKLVRERSVPFTCALGCPPLCGWPRGVGETPIKAMVDEGLWVTLNTDDPAMFQTDIGLEYARFCQEFRLGPERACRFSFAALEASWLDDDDKRRLRIDFTREIDDLGHELGLSVLSG